MPDALPHSALTLGGDDWRLDPGDAIAHDAVGAWCPAEVHAPGGRSADALVHLLEAAATSDRAFVAALRAALGVHTWLSVPTMIPVRAVQIFAGQAAVVSELWPGVRLQDLVGVVPIPPRTAVELAAAVAEGLHGLHAAAAPGSIRPAGLCHGGLDLDHVIVMSNGHVGVLEAGAGPVLAEVRAPAAEPAFVAPEVRGAGRPSAPGDVYAAALLLVCCLSGRQIPPLPDAREGHDAAVDANLAALFEVDPAVAAGLRRALSWAPEVRPSARELAALLREALPRVGGRWLTAWAGQVVPPPAPSRSLEGLTVEEDSSMVVPAAAASPKTAVEKLRPLKKVSAGSADRRQLLARGLGGLALLVLLGLAGLLAREPLTRWWLDNHGPMDMPDVPTDQPVPVAAVEPGVGVAVEDPSAPDPAGGPDPVAGDPPGVVVVDRGGGPAGDPPAAPPGARAAPAGIAVSVANEPAPPPPVRVIRVGRPVPLPVVAPDPSPDWGEDFETPGEDVPLVQVAVDVENVDRAALVCANGVRALAPADERRGAHLAVEARAGRCDVRAEGTWGVATGTFRATGSGAFTCRLEFLDQLRCSPRR